MPIDLSKPLAWKLHTTDPDVAELLTNLQGNILKGHGRPRAAQIFLEFAVDQVEAVRKFLGAQAVNCTRALEQLEDAESVRSGKIVADKIFRSVLLTSRGYSAIGEEARRPQSDQAFLDGMRNRADLKDPAVEQWQAEFRQEYHACILLAASANSELEAAITETLNAASGLLKSNHVQRGQALFNMSGDGIEHFGYVDGRSQPLCLVEDLERERDTTDGIDVWDPSAPLGQALVQEQSGNANHFGSFFVFRKLEQDVQGFKTREKRIGEKLGAGELAGAWVVGRFEDGTPVAQQSDGGSHHPVPNNFNYNSDQAGLKCPFHSHIRKTNPRNGLESGRLMFRRGIPWDEVGRLQHPNQEVEESLLPTGGVGLLFMAYQSSLESQFEFTQSTWADNPSFPADNTGIDPVIGQGQSPIKQEWPTSWGAPGTPRVRKKFEGFVKLLGGEYFFAPSLAFLESLA